MGTVGIGRVRNVRRRVLVPALAGAAVVLVVGLWAFQPWRLFTSTTVREALPGGPPPAAAAPSTAAAAAPAGPTTAATTAGAPAAATGSATEASPATGPVTLATGTFVSHEHRTTGQVRLLRLADGSRIVRLENLDTSDGPALRVWLSDQPVRADRSGWGVFDDGASLDLGDLKGNIGDQNYSVPAGADLDRLTSLSIWCARFHVSFGAAGLTPATT